MNLFDMPARMHTCTEVEAIKAVHEFHPEAITKGDAIGNTPFSISVLAPYTEAPQSEERTAAAVSMIQAVHELCPENIKVRRKKDSHRSLMHTREDCIDIRTP